MFVFQLLCFDVVFGANLASATVLINGFFHAFPIYSSMMHTFFWTRYGLVCHVQGLIGNPSVCLGLLSVCKGVRCR